MKKAVVKHSYCRLLVVLLLAALCPTSNSHSQPSTTFTPAPVMLDGHEVIMIKAGTGQYTPAKRAAAIGARLKSLAANDDQSDQMQVVDSPWRTDVIAGDTIIAAVFPEDAQKEGKSRQAVAQAWRDSLQHAAVDYRSRRTPQKRILRVAGALLILACLVAIIFGLKRLTTRMAVAVQVEVERRSAASEKILLKSASNVAGRLIRKIFALLRIVLYIVVAYAALHALLFLSPATRPAAVKLGHDIMTPIHSFEFTVWRNIPSLIFVVIIVVVAWYSIKAVRFYFDQIRDGVLVMGGFKASWAGTTQRLISIGILVLAVLIAYPYIPGSQSAAFKGVSLFLGVLVSIGSSGSIANIIGSVMLTYTEAFDIGDLVKIGDTTGLIIKMGLLTTRVRTRKNEVVSIPNSLVLSSQIVNYSAEGKNNGLVLGARAGIGYDTSWQQVEAMMLMAAGRTPGVRKQPTPIVVELSLNSFDVTYELNVFMEAGMLPHLVLAELHRNILDVFNEYGVQIMTPAYVSDPETMKIVSPVNFYAAPAQAPSVSSQAKSPSQRNATQPQQS